MHRTIPVVLTGALSLALAACPSADVDTGEDTLQPTVEFDPSSSVIPFPNNLVLDPTNGLVTLPQQCGESATQTAVREGFLNALDGFGTFKGVMRLTLTEAADPASLADNIIMYRIASNGSPTDPVAEPQVPVVAFPSTTDRFSADCATSETIQSVIIVPSIPLEPTSTYSITIKTGIKTESGGGDYIESATWNLVRQATNPVNLAADGSVISERTPFSPNDPVGLATIQGIDLLWKAHAGALTFLDGATSIERDDVLLAWTFNTQTTTAPLDAAVADSPASTLPGTIPAGMASIAGGNGEAFLVGALGGPTCAAIGCAAVDDVIAGGLVSPNFQTDGPNALSGGDPVPAHWDDPRNPTQNGDNLIQVFALVPVAAPPAGGYPTVIFGHGITRSKEDFFAIGPQLAANGFASVAIDWVGHGSRAVQISDEAALGCSGTPDPTAAPQCFGPFFSSNLGGTRDNFRQSILDLTNLAAGIGDCTSGTCAGLEVDPDRIGYIGHSLGGIIGSMAAAQSSDIQASVLNVAGAGLVDLLENTDTLGLVCGLVDALIDAGVIVGDKSDLVADPPTGICTGDTWKEQAAYQSFATVARWLLDPADPANFAQKLAAKTFLLQKVTDDTVVPNITTDQLGALSGLAVAAAAENTGTAAPSSAITTDPALSKFVEYGAANEYGHSSILQPSAANADAQLGTAQMQTDLITFLLLNL